MSEAASATTFVLVRHGETRWNVEGRFQGHHDSPLTPRGEHQAEAVARRIRLWQVDRLFCSPLGRARQTVGPVAAVLARPVEYDDRLKETCVGIFEGLTGAEARDRFPEEFAAYMRHDPDRAPPGGESPRERQHRALGWLHDIACQAPGATIAAVTHGAWLSGVFRSVIGLEMDVPRRFHCLNGSINVFRSWGAERVDVLTWGEVSHL